MNALYEYLYDLGTTPFPIAIRASQLTRTRTLTQPLLGTMLQTPKSMEVFNLPYRPWPHVFKSGLRSKRFYEKMDANLAHDLERLRTYENRADSVVYKSILLQVLSLFGKGIVESLEYTMKDYLRQTNGPLSNERREEWELQATKHMLSHNNHAERPFAVLRAFAKMYPALSLRNLSWLAHSLVNGTHRPERLFGAARDSHGNNLMTAGIAVTAHRHLKQAVNIVCSVRRKTVGAVTRIVREAQNSDKTEQCVNRKRKALEKHEHLLRLKALKAAKVDEAEHTANHALVLSVIDLEHELAARQTNKQSQISYLKKQFDARVIGNLKP